jgi:hypothetical protein
MFESFLGQPPKTFAHRDGESFADKQLAGLTVTGGKLMGGISLPNSEKFVITR